MLVVRFIQAIPKSREAVQTLGMRAGIVVNVTPADRRRLEAIVADRSAPQRRPTDRTSRPVATRSFDCLVDTYAKPKPGIQRYNSSRNSVLWAASGFVVQRRLVPTCRCARMHRFNVEFSDLGLSRRGAFSADCIINTSGFFYGRDRAGNIVCRAIVGGLHHQYVRM